MKKITQLATLICLSLGWASYASAQITITTADMPTTTTQVIRATDTTTAPSPGSPSASSQNWNYASLKKQKVQSIMFMAPSATKYSSKFPGANLADSVVGTNGYNYFSSTAGQFAVTGAEQIVFYSGYYFQFELDLNPYFLQSNLPATYGAMDNGNSRGSAKIAQTVVIYDSEKVTTNITYWDTIDAYGTMVTPQGSFAVLRQNHHEIDIDTITMRNSFSGTWGPPPSGTGISKTVYHQYNWYTNGQGYILVQMNMDTTSTTVKNVMWDTTAVPLGINELSYSGKILTYPNPCSTQITFSSLAATEQYISVYDITGRELEKVAMENGKAMLNTASYVNGMYMYQLTDKSGNILDRGKFSVQK